MAKSQLPDKVYDEKLFPNIAFQLALLGATDKMMAQAFGVTPLMVGIWKRDHPEFMEAVMRGMMIADAKVAEAMYHRAIGFEKEEEQVNVYKGEVVRTKVRKYYPPDVMAGFRWLSVRHKELWADVKKVENVNKTIEELKVDLSVISTEDLKVLQRLGLWSQEKLMNATETDYEEVDGGNDQT